MATFLSGLKKKDKSTAPVVNGVANMKIQPTELGSTTIREDKPKNNETEYEYMRSMFVDQMSTMPITPVPDRPGQYGVQPQGSDACHLVIAANNANIKWSMCRNNYDSKGCSEQYMKGALMEARPNGIIFGRALIEMFWASVHAGKPGPIRYSNVRMRVIDSDTVTFSSDWTFNTMGGVILLEKWRRQSDGSFLLDEDRFHIQNVYAQPRIASPEEQTLGLQPQYNINEVMLAVAKRIEQFNSGDVEGFINSYTAEALQTVDPLANSRGHDAIRKFASQYIVNRANFGNGKLTYNNFSVKVMDNRTVHVSGDWDLGGRDNPGCLKGYMNIQRYVKQNNGQWLLELDDWTVEPTPFLY